MHPLTEAQNAQLVERVSRGDREAFSRLYDAHAAQVFGLIVRILQDPEAAQEVAQQTFLKLWSRARLFEPARGRFVAWLLTIARRQAIDRYRLERARPQEIGGDTGAAILETLESPESSGEEGRWRALRLGVAALPPDQRRPIELAYYYALSHSEIAEALHVPLGTVKTRIRLGMEKLRRFWMGGSPSRGGSGQAGASVVESGSKKEDLSR